MTSCGGNVGMSSSRSFFVKVFSFAMHLFQFHTILSQKICSIVKPYWVISISKSSQRSILCNQLFWACHTPITCAKLKWNIQWPPTVSPVKPEEKRHPCNPSPCGANAVCNERNGAGACSCLPEYLGDPYGGCRPECVTNTDCPRDRACLNNKCKDPCPGTCGLFAQCFVTNHAPLCECLPGYTGNALSSCHPIPEIRKLLKLFVRWGKKEQSLGLNWLFCLVVWYLMSLSG